MRAVLIAAMLAGTALGQDAACLLPIVTADEWTPLSLGSKLACWYDAADSSTVLDATDAPATNGAAVQTWRDKSGNERHAYAYGARSPLYKSSAIVSDGDDTLDMTNAFLVAAAKADVEIYVVAKDASQSGGESGHGFVFWNVPGSYLARAALYGRSSGFRWVAAGRYTDASSVIRANAGEFSGRVMVAAQISWATGTVTCHLAGTNTVANMAGGGTVSDSRPSTLATMLAAGDAYVPDGSELCEVLVLDSATSTQDRTSVYAYLRRKWGVQ